MRPPKERERGCFLLGAGWAWWCSLVGVPEVVCLTNCREKERTIFKKGTNWHLRRRSLVSTFLHFQLSLLNCRIVQKNSEVNLSDEFLLLGRIRHVLMNMSEELLQSLLRVLLSWWLALLLRALAQRSCPLQGQHSALGRGAARCQQLQVILSEERASQCTFNGSYFTCVKKQ